MIKAAMKRGARFGAKSVFAVADMVAGKMPGPRILIYHQVGSGLGRQMEVTEAGFRSHLDWIESHGEVVDLENALASRSLERSRRMFVLTFDDGYRDVYENAWPMLEKRRLPFTLYLTTDPVESQAPLTPGGSADPLTWDQVREMRDSGLMTLGAHTHTHADLTQLDVAGVREEVERSNDLIEERTGIRAEHFTYPWGYWSRDADEVVRASYESATLGSGEAVTGERDLFTVNRIPVQLSDGTFFFKRKMARGMKLEDRVRRRITGYRGP